MQKCMNENVEACGDQGTWLSSVIVCKIWKFEMIGLQIEVYKQCLLFLIFQLFISYDVGTRFDQFAD